MLTRLSLAKPRTQKARGLQGLILGTDQCLLSGYAYNQIYWMSCKDKLAEYDDTSFTGYHDTVPIKSLIRDVLGGYMSGEKLIARPCPVTPRHGFVESRVVETVGGLRAVCRETLAADPRGEVLLMPFLDNATHSAVLTNQGLSFGSGHDGATAGKNAVLIPCHSNIAAWIDGMLGILRRSSPSGQVELARSRFIGYTKNPKRQPYLELVDKTIVQARYGPMIAVGATAHYPTDKTYICLSDIWEPSTETLNDFSLFETTLRAKIAHEGADGLLCLYLPHGTLSCHAAVQGICYGAAVVTGPEKPVIYRTIYVPRAPRAKYTLSAIKTQIKHGLTLGRETSLAQMERQEKVIWAAAVVQGMASVPITPQSAKFLSAATTILLRAGLMACFAEHRHFRKFEVYGDRQTPIAPMSPGMKSLPTGNPEHGSRSTYYSMTSKATVLADKTLYALLGKTQAVESDFNDCQWQLAMGGAAWGNCTRAVRLMLIAYMRLQLKPPSEPTHAHYSFLDSGNLGRELRAAIAASNLLLTVSHNNGRCLTKFVTATALKGVTHAPGLYLMHPLTREVLNDVQPQPTLDSETGITPTVS